MASSKMVQCSCGRTYNSSVLDACPACRARANQISDTPSSSSSSSNFNQASMARRESRSATAATQKVTSDAESRASSLLIVASVVSVIGIIGGVITCLSALFLLRDEASRPIGILLLASGFAAILIWGFIGTFAQTVAAGVKILVVIARSQEHSN